MISDRERERKIFKNKFLITIIIIKYALIYRCVLEKKCYVHAIKNNNSSFKYMYNLLEREKKL